ncbi:hypothetical protein [Microbacterium sp.]|uniref:hypothetical protein n=1 Tax=Microbacterium sp. TaxID=51671 RepID=UPI003A8AB90F
MATEHEYEPLTWRQTKGGEVRIFRGGRAVTTLRGATAARTAAQLGLDAETDQRVLQRATGEH